MLLPRVHLSYVNHIISPPGESTATTLLLTVKTRLRTTRIPHAGVGPPRSTSRPAAMSQRQCKGGRITQRPACICERNTASRRIGTWAHGSNHSVRSVGDSQIRYSTGPATRLGNNDASADEPKIARHRLMPPAHPPIHPAQLWRALRIQPRPGQPTDCSAHAGVRTRASCDRACASGGSAER